jgi:hypothetical protein
LTWRKVILLLWNMRIITDTCIWYRIADGIYDKRLIKSLPLTATALNFIELLSSPKLSTPDGRLYILKILRNIIELNPYYNLMAPYDFAAREYLGKKIRKKFHLSQVYDICKYGFSEESIQYYISLRKNRVDDFKHSITTQIINNRTNAENMERLKKANEAALSAASDFLRELSNVLAINVRNVNTNRIFVKGKGMELYIRSRAHYNQKLFNVANYQVNGNDQLDLSNLLYVKHEDTYWTTDTKWINIIRTVNMSHKLFNIYPDPQ